MRRLEHVPVFPIECGHAAPYIWFGTIIGQTVVVGFIGGVNVVGHIGLQG